MSRPRLAVYGHTVLPASQTFVKYQTEAFDRFDVELFGVARNGALSVSVPTFLLEEQGRIPALHVALYKVLRRSGRLRRAITTFGPDVLLAHFAQDAWRVAPTARSAGVPLVVACHGTDVLANDAYAATAERSMRQLVRHWPDLADAAAGFIASSQFVADALIARGVPSDKVHVRYLGTPLPASVPDGDRSGLLFVGRLESNKGADDAIRAHARASRAVPGLTLTLAGEGSEAPALRELAESLGTAGSVMFTGAVPPSTVDELMRTHAVVLVPSRVAPTGASEGFGLVAVEAAARRLPVVAYATGGLPEAVGDDADSGGVLVPTGDVDALAEATVRLLDDPVLAAELGRRGRDRAQRLFDLGDCTRRIEDLLLEFAGVTP